MALQNLQKMDEKLIQAIDAIGPSQQFWSLLRDWNDFAGHVLDKKTLLLMEWTRNEAEHLIKENPFTIGTYTYEAIVYENVAIKFP